MSVTRLSPSRRREDIRAWWAEHLQAQRESGQTQVVYCRSRGLDPKYFTLWKHKLLDARAAAGLGERPQLVPVVVRTERATFAPDRSETNASSAVVAIRLNLGNGISLSLEVATGSISTLVRELAAVRC
jgi:hypothetical protein